MFVHALYVHLKKKKEKLTLCVWTFINSKLYMRLEKKKAEKNLDCV